MRAHLHRLVFLAILVLALNGSLATGEAGSQKDCSKTSTGLSPLTDLGSGLYLGQFQGGLYENGSNTIPTDHLSTGLAQASLVVPRDAGGNQSSAGKIVMISIGMSNTRLEYCGGSGDPCLIATAESFMAKAAADPLVNHSTLAILNGANSGETADSSLRDPAGDLWVKIRDQVLIPLGVTEAQVQVIWLKVALKSTSGTLPSATAGAYRLETDMGQIVRAAKIRYPNLKLLYVTSRIYGGYASDLSRSEPLNYEYGFGVKWLIDAQIKQLRGQGIDPRAGDLLLAVAPWLAWGPYLWADGVNPRSDGLTWLCADFRDDGVHLLLSRIGKFGQPLLDFFKTDPTTNWFLAGAVVGTPGPPASPTVGTPGPTATSMAATLTSGPTVAPTATATRDATQTPGPTGAPTATATPDTQPPSVAIVFPSAGAVVSGVVTVAVEATDNVRVQVVRILLDGQVKKDDSSAPYTWDWDTRLAPNGQHTLSARAGDYAQNLGYAQDVVVTVAN